MNTKRFITLTLGGLLLASPVYLAAQDQSQGESVADAARKAQAEKKDAPKPKMVIDNDSLDKITGTINVVGEEPAKADDQDKKQDDKDKKAPAKDETYWRQKFADANKKLADDEKELDILQREYNLKQQQYYADPMAELKQEYTRQDLNDSKEKIDAKTADVAADKAAISDLEDQLRQAGGDPGWASAPAQPASESAPSQ
jgi:chromosome segregation ATPase